MKATTQLHAHGQSPWLDNNTHDLLNSGALQRYINDHAVTGLMSNPTIFEQAILPEDGGNAKAVLHEFAEAGIDADALAAQLQLEGAQSFTKSWNGLMAMIASKSDTANWSS